MKNTYNKAYAIFACILAASVVVFGEVTLNAAISGFQMWLCCVMPSVFPFFVCVTLMQESGILSGGSRIALFLGCALSGAPAGSRLCASLADDGIIPQEKLSAYCAACNMASPAFMTGSLFVLTGSRAYMLPVMAAHYGAALLTLCFISRRVKITNHPVQHKTGPLAEVLTSAVTEGFSASLRVCGVIVFFTVLISVIMQFFVIFGIVSPHPVLLYLTGLLEMTNGIAFTAGMELPFGISCALIAFCMSFGGICIMIQTMSTAHISAKKYLLAKLFVAVAAGIMAFMLSFIPQSSDVLASTDQAMQNGISTGLIALSSVLSCGVVWLVFSRARRV